MIKTDGVGCSILLIKTQNNIPIKVNFKLQKEHETKINNLDKYSL